MKKEQNILHDVIGTAPPKEESKTRKYIRIIFTSVFLSLLALVVIMAAVRKFGA
jgi:hypothetical protein